MSKRGFAELGVKDSEHVTQNVTQNDADVTQNVTQNESKNDIQKIPKNKTKISPAERLSEIIRLVKQNNTITRNELADKLKVTSRTISRDIEKLKEMNKLEYEGSAKKGRWVIIDN